MARRSAKIVLRRSIPTPDGGKMFGDGETVMTTRPDVVKDVVLANLTIALAYGDRVSDGDEVLISDQRHTRLITVDFARD